MGCSDISYGSLDSKCLFPLKVEKLVPKEVYIQPGSLSYRKAKKKILFKIQEFFNNPNAFLKNKIYVNSLEMKHKYELRNG